LIKFKAVEPLEIVSALVCTRDRPGPLLSSIRSLLASDGEQLELIVIDQSEGPESEQAAALLASDPRLHYVRSRSRGKGAALNEGLRLARGAIVVCTDDDCEAPLGWVAGMARTLEEQPTAAIVFCNVRAMPYDRSVGYVPTYERCRSRLLRSILSTCAGHGLGAGMALRRDIALQFGGFDESFGPGARFASADELDMCNRILLGGWHVYETADLTIFHHGFRTLAQGRQHARRDWIGIGAACAKPLRAGHLEGMVVALWRFTAHALWPSVLNLLRLQRPHGLARIVGFIQGFGQGLLTPVDRRTLLYVRR
jgi:glycosyltransferase involved in cell wall biosynthesis